MQKGHAWALVQPAPAAQPCSQPWCAGYGWQLGWTAQLLLELAALNSSIAGEWASLGCLSLALAGFAWVLVRLYRCASGQLGRAGSALRICGPAAGLQDVAARPAMLPSRHGSPAWPALRRLPLPLLADAQPRAAAEDGGWRGAG